MRRDSINRTIAPNTATAGYGFGIGDMGGWWGHDGQIPGYTTAVMHNYDLDTTIIVLVNSDIPLPGDEGTRTRTRRAEGTGPGPPRLISRWCGTALLQGPNPFDQ